MIWRKVRRREHRHAVHGPAAIPSRPADCPSATAEAQRAISGWRLLHPLTAICAVQAVLSLTLIWSNTAYIDEADYLWVGHLEIAHWLHGTSWPSGYAVRLSGSPVIYPPLGALADSIGGLAGARILSLIFMLGATILLYLTASRLIGRTGAHCRLRYLGAERASYPAGFRHLRSAVGASHGALGMAHRASRLPSPSRRIGGRVGGRPCPGQRDGVLGDRHRPCGDRLRVPGLAAPHAGETGLVLAQPGSREDWCCSSAC